MGNSLLRPLNAIPAFYSFLAGTCFGQTTAFGLPLAAGIELTNHCNLKCPQCNSGSGLMTRSRGYMSINLFDKIIGELGQFLFNINLYFQGESMLHPEFFLFLERSRNIHTTLSTNGHFLSPETSERIVRSGLNKLIVSLDGMDPETYSSYRVNGDYNRVISGIRNVAEARKRDPSGLKLIIQFLVNRNNEDQIKDAVDFAREMNASLHLKSMQIITDDSFESWLPSAGKYSRYKREAGGYKIKSALPDRCLRLWLNPVITWDGKVIPCCFDKDARYEMGDMNKESFMTIWNRPEYKSFRKKVCQGRSSIDICRNCTSGFFRLS